MTLRTVHHESLVTPELRAIPLSVGSFPQRFDINIDLAIRTADGGADGIDGFLEYNCEAFERHRIESLIAQFAQVLKHCVANPYNNLASAPLTDGRFTKGNGHLAIQRDGDRATENDHNEPHVNTHEQWARLIQPDGHQLYLKPGHQLDQRLIEVWEARFRRITNRHYG